MLTGRRNELDEDEVSWTMTDHLREDTTVEGRVVRLGVRRRMLVGDEKDEGLEVQSETLRPIVRISLKQELGLVIVDSGAG